MDDSPNCNVPAHVEAIRAAAAAIDFDMSCEDKTGALLRVLVASRPRSRFLELGTGAGVSTAWILDGMDSASTLLSVVSDAKVAEIAKAHLGNDPRVRFCVQDGEQLLKELQGQHFDLIFADTWPGKYYALEACLNLLTSGGLYVIDDLLPQANWPDGHAPKVAALIETLELRTDFTIVKMAWASGLILATKR
jgi:predicted O-methyltransferase YrrM